MESITANVQVDPFLVEIGREDLVALVRKSIDATHVVKEGLVGDERDAHEAEEARLRLWLDTLLLRPDPTVSLFVIEQAAAEAIALQQHAEATEEDDNRWHGRHVC